MKKIIHFLFMCLFCHGIIGQVNPNIEVDSRISEKPEPSKAIEALYEQAKYLENNGTPIEIEQNRLAIKNEWQTIKPEIAALYKPVEVNLAAEEFDQLIPTKSSFLSNSSTTNKIWGDDLIVHEGLMSGVDMEVSASGEIYLLGYYNELNVVDGSNVYIYRSTDNGTSFSLWDEISIPGVDYNKMELVLLEPDQYLAVYVLTETEVFGVYRWNLNTQDLEFQIIAAGVSDFAVDRNFPNNTNNARVFATYLKPDGGGCANKVFSARSTSGSFGLDWVDESLVSTICSEYLDLTYGLSGATYAAYVSTTTGNTYAHFNNNYNDPASWSDEETVTNGANIQIGGLSISAARKSFASDEVILFASYRTAGSTDDFNMFSFRRENENPFVIFDTFGIPDNGTDILRPDSWIRKESGVEVIRLSYVVSEGLTRTLRTKTYDGLILGSAVIVSDIDEVYAVTAIAETQDESACLAFSMYAVIDGENIYFDTDSTLGTEDTTFSNLQYYPNPASETLTIRAAQTIDKVELYTITGKKVKEFTPSLTEVALNIQDLSAGVYIATVHSNNQSTNFKLVKN